MKVALRVIRGCFAALVVWSVGGNSLFAQEADTRIKIGAPQPAISSSTDESVDERLRKLEHLYLELLKQKTASSPAVTPAGAVDGEVSLIQKLNEPKEQAPKEFIVGKSLGLTGTWVHHQPWFETEDKSFRVHFGGRTQLDFVGTGAAENVKFGTGGIGPFENAVNFRRARLEADGWIYETIDFFFEYDWANSANFASPPNVNNTFAVPAPTDLWVGINYLPMIGSIRIGNLKNPIGLDHLTSSRYLDFLERSPGFDAYYNRQNGFVPGIMIFNWSEDERISWQYSITKFNNQVYPWNVGNDEFNLTGRITGLPYYEDEGRYMMHLGFGAQWGRPDERAAVFRDRVLMRNGPAVMHTTVALAQLACREVTILNPEFFMNIGPLSIQAEYLASWADNVTLASTQSQTNIPIANRTFFSQTAYIQALYFLTGEHRPYGKTALHGSGAAPTRVVPYRNFFWVPGYGCPNPFSHGAWQVGGRYSYIDLTNIGINGGVINEMTFGLNWFLNPNMKIQWNYDFGHREIDGATSSGWYYAYGARMAFDF